MNDFARDLLSFCEFGRQTQLTETTAMTFGGEQLRVPTFVNEFWTAKQRAAHSLHEISYRACFKPQLPHFFIQRLTRLGEIVYDPFMGRGTTVLESGLLGRVPFGCDVNPLSLFLCGPRLDPPTLPQVARRLAEIDFADAEEHPEDLLAFYHPATLKEICALKKYLLGR
ncbi:MAG: DNA methyltransferase, partial [Verrucomicrobiota bacterium]